MSISRRWRPVPLAVAVTFLGASVGVVTNIMTGLDDLPGWLAWLEDGYRSVWAAIALIVLAGISAGWSALEPKEGETGAAAINNGGHIWSDGNVIQAPGGTVVLHESPAGSGPVGLGRTELREVGVPVESLSDQDAFERFEVHPAIVVQPDNTALPALTAYVRRALDDQLAEVVSKSEQSSQIAVLVGDTSTGKTRACWEAVRAMPAGWRVWHPLAPTPVEALLGNIAHVRPRTVLWLGEIQLVLRDERAAAALRELLREPDRGPVLVLGTSWERLWDSLVTDPADGHPDPHPQARGLLSGRGIRVPREFSSTDLTIMRGLATGDPRLALADSQGTPNVAQFLAGVPEVLRRYSEAPVEIQVIATVAMDARRLGVTQYLPEGFLHDAAEGYLGDDIWNRLDEQTWFTAGLDYLGRPCLGVPGPLTRIRPRPNQTQPVAAAYKLADALDDHGRTARRHATAPSSLWTAALTHLDDSDSLLGLARSADDRGYFRLSAQLAARASNAGNDLAAVHLAQLARRLDPTIDTTPWLRRAAETTSDATVTWQLAQRLDGVDQAAEASRWWRRTVELDRGRSIKGLVTPLSARDELLDAVNWLRPAAEAGYPPARAATARLLEAAGQHEDALIWHKKAAEASDDYVPNYARALEIAGDIDAAITVWTGRDPAQGGGYRRTELLRLLFLRGRHDEANSMLESTVRVSGKGTMKTIARMLIEANRPEDAARLWQVHAEDGDFRSVARASTALVALGYLDAAKRLWQPAVASGDGLAMRYLAHVHQTAGDPQEAESWLRAAIKAGYPPAAGELGALLAGRSDTEGAITFWREQVLAGSIEAVPHLERVC